MKVVFNKKGKYKNGRDKTVYVNNSDIVDCREFDVNEKYAEYYISKDYCKKPGDRPKKADEKKKV
jgi:hypothetical protein